jgi:hypothetical protein
VASPSPTGTFTLQDAPSFAWRTNTWALSGSAANAATEALNTAINAKTSNFFMVLAPIVILSKGINLTLQKIKK